MEKAVIYRFECLRFKIQELCTVYVCVHGGGSELPTSHATLVIPSLLSYFYDISIIQYYKIYSQYLQAPTILEILLPALSFPTSHRVPTPFTPRSPP